MREFSALNADKGKGVKISSEPLITLLNFLVPSSYVREVVFGGCKLLLVLVAFPEWLPVCGP